jgi:hypothetical protein
VYGHGVYFDDKSGSSDGFILTHCDVHNFGGAAIISHAQYGTNDIEVSYNLIHTGQQLQRFDKLGGIGWGGAIHLRPKGLGKTSNCTGLHVHHNVVYDIAGEGMFVLNGIVEYNIVGNTGSFGITTEPADYNSEDSIIRYNLVVFIDYSTSPYTRVSSSDGASSGKPTGIRYFDDYKGGDNSLGNQEIYGNVVINRTVGIWFYSSEDPNNPLNSINIYNNTVIDSVEANYRFYHSQEANAGDVYHNSSILYDRPNSKHVQLDTTFPSTNWTINNNHFWTNGGSPVVASAFRNNYDTRNPKLMGEPSINWIKQTGATYYMNINPILHLNPPSDSPIYGMSPLLTMDIEEFINALSASISPPSDFRSSAN